MTRKKYIKKLQTMKTHNIALMKQIGSDPKNIKKLCKVDTRKASIPKGYSYQYAWDLSNSINFLVSSLAERMWELE